MRVIGLVDENRSRVLRRAVLLFVLMSALLLTGCAQELVIQVDAIASRGAVSGQRYILRSNMEGVSEEDLYFREFAGYVHAALAQRGYRRAKDADMVIYLNYGISSGKTHYYTVTTPVYDWVQSETVEYSETETDESGNVTQRRGSTTYPLRERVVGMEQSLHSYTSYTSHLVLDARERGSHRPLWRTTVTAGGEAQDLRRVIPLLAAAVVPFIGRDSGERVRVKIKKDDPRVRRLLGR